LCPCSLLRLVLLRHASATSWYSYYFLILVSRSLLSATSSTSSQFFILLSFPRPPIILFPCQFLIFLLLSYTPLTLSSSCHVLNLLPIHLHFFTLFLPTHLLPLPNPLLTSSTSCHYFLSCYFCIVLSLFSPLSTSSSVSYILLLKSKSSPHHTSLRALAIPGDTTSCAVLQ
jgi:hypothetical protein